VYALFEDALTDKGEIDFAAALEHIKAAASQLQTALTAAQPAGGSQPIQMSHAQFSKSIRFRERLSLLLLFR